MSLFTLTVNGQPRTVDVDPETPLLFVLTDELELRGPKFGCGLGQCGSCTVIAGGRAIRSCTTPVRAATGAAIVTLEGLGTPDQPHRIQQAFIDEQAAQCGFCLSGVILTAKAFLDANPKATEAQIEQALATVLCRCFGHTRMLRAIHRYATEERRQAVPADREERRQAVPADREERRQAVPADREERRQAVQGDRVARR